MKCISKIRGSFIFQTKVFILVIYWEWNLVTNVKFYLHMSIIMPARLKKLRLGMITMIVPVRL